MRLVIVLACACSQNAAPPAPRNGPPLRCELADYTVDSVNPYAERDPRSKIGATHPGGAELFIEAQPTVTAEWLQLQLTRHIEGAPRAALSAACPLDVPGASVSVRSGGTGFIVRIRAEREDDANEILRRARALGPK
jgi:hypothetical protein